MLFTIKKMPVSVRFKLRPGKEPHLLQCRLSVDGKEDSGTAIRDWNGNYVKLHKPEWNQTTQKLRGNSDEASKINKILSKTQSDLLAVHERQLLLFQEMKGPEPTTLSVRYGWANKTDPWIVRREWIEDGKRFFGFAWAYEKPPEEAAVGLTPSTDINEAFGAYLKSLKTSGKRDSRGQMQKVSRIVLERYKRTQGLLKRYQKTELPVSFVSVNWADQFHSWLQAQPESSRRANRDKISAPYATRHVRKIAELLGWLHRQQGVLPGNVLLGVKWVNYETKPVTWMTQEQISLLEGLQLTDRLNIARWWLLLMCYTGLDYPDARQYTQKPENSNCITPDGPVITGRRCKPPHVWYCIPRIKKVDTLLAEFPGGPTAYAPQTLNEYIRKDLAPLIGFKGTLTIKIARKTAGMFFLESGFDIAAVSSILGHSKIDTTERHYTKASEKLVQNNMRKTRITE